MLGRNEAQAARRRQLDLVHDADDERKALRAQALLHCPQGICSACRFDEHPPRRTKTESGKSAPVRRPELMRELGWPAPQDAMRSIRGSCKALQPAYGEPQRKAECRRPVAGRDARCTRRRLHLVQRCAIERAADTAVDLGFAERPRDGPGMRFSRLLQRERVTLELADVGAQVRQHLGLGGPRTRLVIESGPRDGEGVLAIPVRARAPKPNATQPVTRTSTGAWLWPRDRGPTAGRWGGGWGRLIHGERSRNQPRRRQLECRRSFFVLCRHALPVKTKTGTKAAHLCCSHSPPRPSRIFHRRGLAHRRIDSPRDRDAALSGWELPEIQALASADGKQRGQKATKPRQKVRCKHRCVPHALPRKNGTVIYRAFT